MDGESVSPLYKSDLLSNNNLFKNDVLKGRRIEERRKDREAPSAGSQQPEETNARHSVLVSHVVTEA